MARSRSRSRSAPRPDQGGYKGRPVQGKNNVLFIAGLDQQCKRNELYKWVEEAGFDVSSVDIPMDSSRGSSKGYGFVDLKDERDVDAAIKELNGKQFNGRQLKVEQKQSRVFKRQNDRDSRRRGGRDGGRGRSDSRRRGGGGGRRRGGRDSRSR